MKIDTLFNIKSLEISEDGCNSFAVITLDPDHDIFKGHFPENPVLPGVCLVHIIKSVMIAAVEKPLMMFNCQSIKFQLPVNPLENNILEIDIKNKSTSDFYDVSVQVSYGDKKFCNFRGSFKTL
ncbi:MAG: hypothetical protein PHT69_06190 [Bacteroidales bacterium]|nr:hypothetical protein [Bacteroidales bacterium]